MECSGDESETCGGRNAISVYEFTDDSSSGYAGCFVDSTRDRVLTGPSKKNDPDMTSAVSGARKCVHGRTYIMATTLDVIQETRHNRGRRGRGLDYFYVKFHVKLP